MRISKKSFFYFFILSSCILSFSEVKGQLQLVPNTQAFKQDAQNQRVTRGVTHSLPFFEDFSTSTRFPDVQKWENGGIYITNQMAINPPSLNAAIFDGVDVNGFPYNFQNAQATGASDSLTSCPIDLSGLITFDNVYLSFFWQLEGRGEFPDEEDFLRIQFKDNEGNWETVWTQTGGANFNTFNFDVIENGDTISTNPLEVQNDTVLTTQKTQFNQALIFIEDPKYFHEEFQFSFQTFSRLSGIYDTWLVDYIYINTNRNANDTLYFDAVAVETSPSLLKNYAAMPAEHFTIDPSSFLNDSLSFKILNLDDNIKGISSYTITLKDTITNTNLGLLQSVSSSFFINSKDPNIPNNNITFFKTPINASLIPNNNSSKALQYELIFDTAEGVGEDPLGLDLTINNSISNVTILDNYYAYDDGTAEFAAGVNQRLGRVAVQYVTSQPDTLTEVRMNIPRLENDLSGETIVLLVLSDLNNADSSVLYVESVSFEYSENRDEFVDFRLTRPVAVQDTFYIAWQQTSDEQFNVGFDRNNNNSDKIFFSIDGGINWNNTGVEGSLLFRPVFGEVSDFPVLGIENEFKSDVKIYPNPNNGTFKVEGNQIERVELVNLQGIVKHEIDFPIPQNYVDCNFQNVSAGVYILRVFQKSEEITTERIVIEN